MSISSTTSTQSTGLFAACGQVLNAAVRVTEALGNASVDIANSVEPTIKRISSTLCKTANVTDSLLSVAENKSRGWERESKNELRKTVARCLSEEKIILNAYIQDGLLPPNSTIEDLDKLI